MLRLTWTKSEGQSTEFNEEEVLNMLEECQMKPHQMAVTTELRDLIVKP